jgi:cytochrome c-type biogenesis protein CcmH
VTLAIFVAVCLLLSAAAAVVLVLALRRAGAAEPDRARLNVAIFRERRAELDAERDAGRIDAAQHAELVAELESLLVGDVADAPAVAVGSAGPARSLSIVAMLLFLLVPVASLLVYAATGFGSEVRDWLALQSKRDQVSALAQPLSAKDAEAVGVSMADAVTLTQASLLRRPADAEAWFRLGVAWLELQSPAQGLEALRTANRLAPDNIDMAMALARVELALNQNRLTDSTRALLDSVLRREPQHQGVLMVYGMAEFESGEFAAAAAHWQRLLAQLDPQSSGAALLRKSIEKAEANAAAKAAGGVLPVRVVLAGIPGGFPETAALFVVVRQAGGPPMPVAAKKLPAKFPLEVTLSDADQMMPGAPLAARGALEVQARVSIAGAATPASGDLESAPVRVTFPVAGAVTLTLDRRIP